MSWSRAVGLPHLLLLFVGGIAVAATVLHFGHDAVLSALCGEDGPIEWTTAGLYLSAGLIFVVRLVQEPGGRIFWFALSVICIFASGGEISWGQRILEINTPSYIAPYNVQDELNVHNLTGIHGSIRAVGLVIVLSLFGLLPLINHVSRSFRSQYRKKGLVVPPLYGVPIAGIAVLFQAVPRLAYGEPVFNLDEVGEFLLSLTFWAFAADGIGQTEENASRRIT